MGKRSRKFFGLVRMGYSLSLVLGVLLLVVSSVLYPLRARAQSEGGAGFVYVATFKQAMTPVSAQYFDRLVKTAEDNGASALIVQLDTPGGLVDSMQVMVQRILGSRVPVIIYVSPRGAMSASAGLFLVYASHVAAMAPNTTVGSAEVIFEGSGDGGEGGNGNDEALRRKATNELVSRIRGLAETRGRNPDFGERAVRESANLDAQEALNQDVIDFVAVNVDEVLTRADGMRVLVGEEERTLRLRGAEQRPLETNFAEDVLLLITNPSVAFVLISLGTLGITWEFINPGSVFPGVTGALLLLTGFLALGTLPINTAGLVFLAVSFILFIADIFTPTHGILTAGGIAALVIGGLLLVNTGGVPGVPTVSPWVIAGTAAGIGLFFMYAVYKVVRARQLQPATGRESLVGQLAMARTDLAPRGNVFVEGELWQATSIDGPVDAGQPVRVVAADGLHLKVRSEPVSQETRNLNVSG
jgi:membrane-bound serine protease (ClpP class)